MNAYDASDIRLPNGNIRISITGRCNMNCFYCHNEGQDKVLPKDLSCGDFVKIFNTAREFGLRKITITGGEPLLHKDFSAIIRYCAQSGLKKIGICTNGILIPRHIETLASMPVIEIAIGIDTCQPDKISKQSDQGILFRDLEKNLRLLKDRGVRFSINTVYAGWNENEVMDICAYCLGNGINLRIIELDTRRFITAETLTDGFADILNKVVGRFGLRKETLPLGKGFVGFDQRGVSVRFYDAYCHNRDCVHCAGWTLRVDANGQAIICYARNEKTPILAVVSETMRANFHKALLRSSMLQNPEHRIAAVSA